MPHFVIDCSKNILKIKSSKEIIQKIYDTTESTELFNKGNIKLRINSFEYYNIKNKLIHLFVFSQRYKLASQIIFLKTCIETFIALSGASTMYCIYDVS